MQSVFQRKLCPYYHCLILFREIDAVFMKIDMKHVRYFVDKMASFFLFKFSVCHPEAF